MLDNPDPGLSEKDQLLHTRKCLLKIGDHINQLLTAYNDPDHIKAWRRLVLDSKYLWIYLEEYFHSKIVSWLYNTKISA